MSGGGYTVRWKSRALKDMERLDRRLTERIHAAVARYAATGEGDVKKLRGRPGEYRLRVGDWRVIFERDGERLVILVLRVSPRGDAYR